MPLFEIISTYVPVVKHINILYNCMVLNGKMGEPNAYLYENCRTTYRKVTSRE